MAKREISRKEISHVIALGMPIEKDEDATPYPCEVIFCQVGSHSLYVIVGINHTDRKKLLSQHMNQDAITRRKIMKCITCGIGNTELGTTTVTLEQDGTIVVFKNVPADIWQLCGEAYTDEDVTDRLLHIIEEEAQKGSKEEFIQYVA